MIVVDAGGNHGAPVPPKKFEDDAARQAIEDLAGDAKTIHALFISHPDLDRFNGQGARRR